MSELKNNTRQILNKMNPASGLNVVLGQRRGWWVNPGSLGKAGKLFYHQFHKTRTGHNIIFTTR